MSVLAINAVMDHSAARGSARVILMCLANYCGDDGVTLFFVPNKRLQRHAKLTERQVRYQLRALKGRLGEVEVVETNKNGAHRYRLNLPLPRPNPRAAPAPQIPQNPQARQALGRKDIADQGAALHREERQFLAGNNKNVTNTSKPAPTVRADLRFRPVRDHILLRYAEINRISRDLVQWDGRDGAALSSWLESHKALFLEDVKRLVDYRFSSDVNPAQPPARWIPRLIEYWWGPLNQYGLPRQFDRECQREERLRAEARIGSNK